MNHRTVSAFCVLFSFILTGCGGNIPLQGKVTLDDGTPLKVGTVNFSSDKGVSRGIIQSDGTYQVGTLKTKDGLPPGSYKVYISGALEQAGEAGVAPGSMGGLTPGVAPSRSLIDPQYTAIGTTPLTCEVPAPKNRFDIKVPANTR